MDTRLPDATPETDPNDDGPEGGVLATPFPMPRVAALAAGCDAAGLDRRADYLAGWLDCPLLDAEVRPVFARALVVLQDERDRRASRDGGENGTEAYAAD